MDINCEYSIDDDVYLIRDNKVYIDRICNIDCEIFEDKHIDVRYKLYHIDEKFTGNELFKNKEELLRSL